MISCLLTVLSYLFSLGDRKPIEKEDEIVVLVVPDYQMLEYVQKIARELSDDPVYMHPLFLTY